jgi:hypothetical protein
LGKKGPKKTLKVNNKKIDYNIMLVNGELGVG